MEPRDAVTVSVKEDGPRSRAFICALHPTDELVKGASLAAAIAPGLRAEIAQAAQED